MKHFIFAAAKGGRPGVRKIIVIDVRLPCISMPGQFGPTVKDTLTTAVTNGVQVLPLLVSPESTPVIPDMLLQSCVDYLGTASKQIVPVSQGFAGVPDTAGRLKDVICICKYSLCP